MFGCPWGREEGREWERQNQNPDFTPHPLVLSQGGTVMTGKGKTKGNWDSKGKTKQSNTIYECEANYF